jgi:hypothetical protein
MNPYWGLKFPYVFYFPATAVPAVPATEDTAPLHPPNTRSLSRLPDQHKGPE